MRKYLDSVLCLLFVPQEAAEEGKEAVESPDVKSGELEPEDKPESRDVPMSDEPPVIA